MAELAKELARLVKANADFPNLIFLLLFQRETVQAALSKISGGEGRFYLEKIVQVGIDLPPVSQDALTDLLFKRISEALDPLVAESEWERERFTDIWYPGLSRYFCNLREVNRFLSSFRFSLSAFSQGGALEVNPVDLIALEVLRISEANVYETIRQNKFLLMPHGRREDGKEIEELANSLLETSDKPEALKQILKHLFPELQKVWENFGYSEESLQSWLSARRICTERFFDRYFLLEVPPQQVSEAVIKQIVNASSNKTALLAILEDLRTRKLILDALERLEAEESLKTLADDFPVWEPTTPGTAQSRSIIIPYHAITR
jgi:predicted KAP-like P-loop ATPase